MRRPHATTALFLLTLVACDDPTLFIGVRPDGGGPTTIVAPEDPFEDEDDGQEGGGQDDGADDGASDAADDGQSTDDAEQPTDAAASRPTPTPPAEPSTATDAGSAVAPPSPQQPAPSGRDGGSGFPPPPPFPNPFADGGLPIGDTGVGLTGIGLDWTTWPPRLRFQLSCRFDADCRRVRQGVCVNSRCVECRESSDCSQSGATCTDEHICVVR